MNILQVVAHFPYPPVGGMETVAYNLSAQLANIGEEVVIAAPSRARTIFSLDHVLFSGIPSWVALDHVHLPRPKSMALLLNHIAWADVVHVHSPHNTFTQFAAFLALVARKPVILSVLSHTGLLKHPSVLGKMLGFILEPIAQVLIWSADVPHVKNRLDQALVSRINVRTVYIPDGVCGTLLSAETKSGSFKEGLELGDAYPLVLYLGRLHPMKGPQEVVKMLPHLLKSYPKGIAVLAGPSKGNYAKKLLLLAQQVGVAGRVVLTGELNEGQKIQAIDDADVVAIPSLSDSTEAFSIVASEAWARGKPVIAYPVGALKTRVKNGINGYLASSLGTEALTTATVNALRLKIVKPAPDVLSWTEVATAFQRVYAGARQARSGNSRGYPH